MKDETTSNNSGEPVAGATFTVELSRAQYRARIFGKKNEVKAQKFNRQNGRTPAQYKKAGFEGYFGNIMTEESEVK